MEHTFKKFVFERAVNGAVAREQIFVQGNLFFSSMKSWSIFLLMEELGK